MIVKDVRIKQSETPVQALDCLAGDGFRQGDAGSLADIDVDFASDRRQEVKEYLEYRYNINGKQRVFSAGTYSTMKLKAVLKDVCRVHKVPVSYVNYITAIFEDDGMSWTDLFKLAATNKKVNKFVKDYPQAIEDIRSLMGQPRSASVHASAIIVTPNTKDGEEVECFDYTPIKKVDDILVSELDGYSIDETGLLKNDCLGIKELAKIQSVIDECNRVYCAGITFEGLVRSELDDEKTYRILCKGHTQNVFQFSSAGMTRFLMDIKPECINDLIAANALYRPATLESGSTQRYLDCKTGNVAPVYLWGTYEALKHTYGQLAYQESLAQMAQEIGGFSLGEGVNLVKYISKKKVDKIHAMKGKFMEGAKEKGCPQEDATLIWDMIESGGSYLFNKCISGKEALYRTNSGEWAPTIEEMYRIMNDLGYAERTGHIELHRQYRNEGYGMSFSLNEYQRLVKNNILDIRYMGKHALYRITLEDGKTLDVTCNHTHPTKRGNVRTDELVPGKDYMFVNVGHDNNDRHRSCILNPRKGHSDFIKCPGNELVKLKYCRRNLMKGIYEERDQDDRRLENHHANGNHSERGLNTVLIKVKSVEYMGEDDVYDVEMEGPYHTFLTTGRVVTCNSHATAYAITSYVGAWLKANYPTAFYTVALQWADDKEIVMLMSEMEQCSSAKIVPPDINLSGSKFFTDYRTDKIFWSLTKIKMVGNKAVNYILAERDKNGNFTTVENFIHRIFKYKLKKYQYWDDPDNEEETTRVPVDARHVKHLILAGCFDKLEGVKAVTERYSILDVAARELGFRLSETDFPAELIDKHYFWSMQQISVSGVGSIDYQRIYNNSEAKDKLRGKVSYMSLRGTLDLDNEGKRVAICATVTEVNEISYKDKSTGEKKKFCKLKLQQNNDQTELVMWSEYYAGHKKEVAELKDKVIIVSAVIKYSDYNNSNSLQTYKTSILMSI